MLTSVDSSGKSRRKKHFGIDARALISLGRDNVRDRITALVELVKNSYDAGAQVVLLEINCGDDAYIRVVDNGRGMNEADVDTKWLIIGHSGKRLAPVSDNRTVTGEKGIGRLSADRLGAGLTLTSKAKDQPPIGISVDWSRFEQEDQRLHQIEVDVLESVNVDLDALSVPPGVKSVQRDSGTELFITNLRDQWTKEDIGAVATELELLFSHLPATAFFSIEVKSNILDAVNRFLITSPESVSAPIAIDAIVDAMGNVSYTITQSESGGAVRELESLPVTHWSALVGLAVPGIIHPDTQMTFPTGPLRTRIEFWPRDASAAYRFNQSVHRLKEFLRNNAGIRLYRDGVGVKPYGRPGDPAFDWLGLGPRQAKNPAGLRRKSYKMKPEQLRGWIKIARKDNPDIRDGAAREGVIENVAFQAMRNFLVHCVSRMELARHKNSSAPTYTDELSPRDQIQEFTGTVKAFEESLGKLMAQLQPNEADAAKDAQERAREVQQDAAAVRSSLETREEEVLALRALATLGIAIASFAHETETSLNHLDLSAINLDSLVKRIDPANIDISEEVTNIRNNTHRLLAWGSFALERIRRHTRKVALYDVGLIVGRFVEKLKPPFAANSITLTSSTATALELKCCVTDVESLVLNLLYNAHDAVKSINQDRIVKVDVRCEAPLEDDAQAKRPNDIVIRVSDSGNGVPDENKDNIWKPLFSTKTDDKGIVIGTGLGLSVVSGVCEDLRAAITLDRDPDLKGARFTIRIPKGT